MGCDQFARRLNPKPFICKSYKPTRHQRLRLHFSQTQSRTSSHTLIARPNRSCDSRIIFTLNVSIRQDEDDST